MGVIRSPCKIVSCEKFWRTCHICPCSLDTARTEVSRSLRPHSHSKKSFTIYPHGRLRTARGRSMQMPQACSSPMRAARYALPAATRRGVRNMRRPEPARARPPKVRPALPTRFASSRLITSIIRNELHIFIIKCYTFMFPCRAPRGGARTHTRDAHTIQHGTAGWRVVNIRTGAARQSITLPENVCRNLSKCRCRPPVSSAEFTVSSGFQYSLLLGGGISFAGTPTAV